MNRACLGIVKDDNFLYFSGIRGSAQILSAKADAKVISSKLALSSG